MTSDIPAKTMVAVEDVLIRRAKEIQTELAAVDERMIQIVQERMQLESETYGVLCSLAWLRGEPKPPIWERHGRGVSGDPK